MKNEIYDVCVIGSGAGGSMASKKLAEMGLSVVIIEEGDIIPPGISLESIKERWEKAYARDKNGKWGLVGYPWSASAVGGGTVFYGGVSYRYRDVDFDASKYVATNSLDPRWPINYKDLDKYYNEVEKLLGVSGSLEADPFFPNEGTGKLHPPHSYSFQGSLIEKASNKKGLHPFPTPLAINTVEQDGFPGCENLTLCSSYSCPTGAKADSYSRILQPTLKKENVTLMKKTKAVKFIQSNPFKIESLECINMQTQECFQVEAKSYILAGNAIQTAALVLRSTNRWWPKGIGNKSGLVGEGLCFKVSEYLSGWVENDYVNKLNNGGLYSTVSIMDYYIDHNCPSGLGGMIYEANPWVKVEGKGTLLQLECILADQPMETNKIRLSNKKNNLGIPKIVIDYQTHELDRLRLDYMKTKIKDILNTIGAKDIQNVPSNYFMGSAHLHGTCRAGNDENTSVVDKFGKFHTIDNLLVADGSYMPFPGGVNPTLTIQANALRIAENLKL